VFGAYEVVIEGGKRLINSIVSVNLKSRAPGRLKGKIVVARHGGGVTIKELRRSETGEDWLLVPYNKEHSPLVIKPEEDNPIIGKVAWWWARQE
jgi:SOS-response transcriptional repressor LexA